ncbi:FIP1[V]-like protein [Impatiens glandulifera]|uniref:FIP1[V]-like protein n=1 Tax=Impatiens glandulifera TaxID=253017 RepID=UPI001FB0FE11|nr:FIP1[V]-like protein [Impatiens glandulifera]
MEEDDEFGDLYSDVLLPLQPPPIPHQQEQVDEPSPKQPIDTNLDSDDEEILFGVPNSNHTIKLEDSQHEHDQVSSLVNSTTKLPLTGGLLSNLNFNLCGKTVDQKVRENDVDNHLEFDINGPAITRVLDGDGEMKLERSPIKDLNLIDESILNITLDGRDDKNIILTGNQENLIDSRETYEKFDIEDAEPVIPGLHIENIHGPGGEGDDWESDSDDDLQIVLNDNNHGNVLMDKSGVMGSDDEDEDGEPLVILGDTDQGHLPMEEVEWGEDGVQIADGDKKELGDADKADGIASAPKIGYSSHGYHPFHSQFKYVRPGAAVVASVGVPGQVRPPAGRGSSDWRPSGMPSGMPTGMKNNVPFVQKGFSAGFGTPLYSSAGRGGGLGGGLEFTLPSHKPIFDVDIDSFEEKPWKQPGIDISDYFNFGLNEESWKSYCKQLEHHRMEATMQSKISVHESGRAENVYDPDLPPELAAAAGMHLASSEPANVGKVDGGLVNGSVRVRPPLPMGRPIQVETGNGERLPSIDTRATRFRDSDAVIEIVLQDFANNDPLPANDAAELPENDNLREDLSGSHESERDIVEEDAKKRELTARSGSCSNSVPDDRSGSSTNSAPNLLGKVKRTFHPEEPLHYSPQPKGSRSPYSDEDTDNLLEDGRAKERADERSPSVIPSDSKKEESTENIDVKHSPQLSSPASFASGEQLSVGHDELVGARSGLRRNSKETSALKTTASANIIPIDEKNYQSLKRQKVSSHIQQSPLQEADDLEDLKAARSSENSKARSGSSRDVQKLNDGMDEEVVQRRNLVRARDMKRPTNEEEQIARRKGREIGKKINVEEGTHSRRDWELEYAHRSNLKAESSLVRRKDKESSDGTWKHRVEDLHVRARAEETRKRGRDNERLEKDEYLQSRKQLENGTSRIHREREVASRQKGRYETMDELRGKRRKEEHLRKDVEKEEILHRKRDRGDMRNKEEIWISRERVEKQKEREEWHKIKQINEDGRGLRSSRIGEDKASYGFKRRDHMDDLGPSLHNRGHEDVLYPRVNQLMNDDRRSRQESANTRNDTNDKKLKEPPTKKRREYKSGDQRTLHSSITSQEQSIIKNELVSSEGGRNGSRHHLLQHQSPRKQKEEVSSGDEHQQRDSRRGRSKMERWTSDKYKTDGGIKEESTLHGEMDGKNSETKPPLDDKHLDTVAKLKKRSERFKLPMPSEKDVIAVVKKIESEPLNSTGGGDNIISKTELEVKPERPTRKRSWTGK